MKETLLTLVMLTGMTAAWESPGEPVTIDREAFEENPMFVKPEENSKLRNYSPAERKTGKHVKRVNSDLPTLDEIELTPHEPISDKIITTADVPEGRLELYGRSSDSFLVYFGQIAIAVDRGLATKMVFTDDNKVYINEPITYAIEDAWIVGDVSEDGNRITIPGGQPFAWVYKSWKLENDPEDYEMWYLFATREIKYRNYDNESGEEYESAWYWQTDENEIVLVKTEDGWKAEDPTVMLTLGTFNKDAKEFSWQGYGDYNLAYEAINDEVVTPPADLQTERYAMIWGYEAKWVQVGYDDNKVYVQSISEKTPGSWSMGEIKGDKVVFPSPQFMGKADDRHWEYIYSGSIQMIPSLETGELEPSIYPDYDNSWEWDANAKRMKRDAYLLSSSNRNEDLGQLWLRTYMKKLSIGLQGPVDNNVKLQTPSNLMTFPFNEGRQNNVVTFYAPYFNVNGEYMGTENLYYQVYFDGELFEFDPIDYKNLTEPTTYIPYTYTDSWDFIHQYLFRTFYFYTDGYEKVGIRMAYDNNGTWIYSDIAEAEIPQGDSGVEMVEDDTVSTTWYDLTGNRVERPANGFYIKVDRKADGSMKSSKVIL